MYDRAAYPTKGSPNALVVPGVIPYTSCHFSGRSHSGNTVGAALGAFYRRHHVGGLLYFFVLVNASFLQELDAPTRIKVVAYAARIMVVSLEFCSNGGGRNLVLDDDCRR